MNRTLFARVAASLVLAGLGMSAAYYLGAKQAQRSMPAPSAASAQTTDAQIKTGNVDPKTGKRILYWQDPMAPGQRFDKPGKSPFMDMPLVPVYESGGDAAAVTVDGRVTQNLAIRTAEVKSGRLAAVLEVPGNITVNERGIEVIQARAAGFVEQAYAKTTLAPVKRGQPLVVIYAPDWVAAQEEYLAVSRMNTALPGDLRSAALARMRQAGMTEAQIRLVESTGKPQPRLAIASDIDGVVTEVGAREGMTIAPGMTLFKVADLSTVWVLADVPESQVSTIRPGQSVTAAMTGTAGSALPGKVDAILPDVNPNTRTVKVRMELQNKDQRLLPGMFVTVRFGAQAGPERLLVPTEALIRTGTRTIVMVDSGNGGFNPTEVKTGAESDGQIEVVEGLRAGQKVVVSGQFLLDSEASLRGTATRMEGASAPATPPASAAVPEYEGIGRIEAIAPDSLTLSHGPIPALQWKAMTMDFMVPASGLAKGLKPGQPVRFRFHMDADGMAMLSSVEPVSDAKGVKP
ncbi:efflux RND transporter periplasmic adaptor subunit [Ralstonia solanacearum]|uniref:efflux RND transporter periplasmic adaptor subunit n=1 Tax=Ralstonia solanacearum TaxID=305 RepID=UPI0005ACBF4E|nr:efflux RND transporter periplasmic adaptor subunit [Ralstonia solanacearum]MDC6177100.1 efflux RND transporter periplasmic adaptor subunit [Ralstonia solanacearum]MDC6238368.1 efflux RND transporter periplasmic adaptor subunit [Ralstonia solanacearum]